MVGKEKEKNNAQPGHVLPATKRKGEKRGNSRSLVGTEIVSWLFHGTPSALPPRFPLLSISGRPVHGVVPISQYWRDSEGLFSLVISFAFVIRGTTTDRLNIIPTPSLVKHGKDPQTHKGQVSPSHRLATTSPSRISRHPSVPLEAEGLLLHGQTLAFAIFGCVHRFRCVGKPCSIKLVEADHYYRLWFPTSLWDDAKQM
ncbi:hypothetical protein BJX64DRAFT_24112 [Aspergillus heterothallicus]